MSKQNIKRLLDELCLLEQNSENQKRKANWHEIPRSGRDQWRGVPRSDHSWRNNIVPVTIDLQNTFWAKYFNFNLAEYYCNAEVFLENYLKITLERFKLFADDTFISKSIRIWGGCGFEGSLFGIRVFSYPDQDPWLDPDPLIKEHKDLNKIVVPDFLTSGMMPQQIRLFEQVKELAGDDFEVLFPEWIRGPFGVAVYLRGFENLLIDLMLDPEFSRNLLGFITESRKNWFQGLQMYLGGQIRKGNLYNDEINCPTLSPDLYREIILPFEQELCDFHGGILYWHSCGDVSSMLKVISKIQDIDMMHVGPWTSVDQAGQVFATRTPLEICMNPVKDVLEADQIDIRRRVTSILDTCAANQVCGFSLRVSGISVHKSIKHTLEQVKAWNSAAKQIIENR